MKRKERFDLSNEYSYCRIHFMLTRSLLLFIFVLHYSFNYEIILNLINTYNKRIIN